MCLLTMTCITPVYVGKVPLSTDGLLYYWLRYQKAIGVDHVHMIAEDTIVAAGYFNHPVFRAALKENYLSIDFWPEWFNSTEILYRSQHLAYMTACIVFREHMTILYSQMQTISLYPSKRANQSRPT